MTTNTSAASGTSRAATFARYGLAASAVAFPVLMLLALLLSPWGDFTAEGREYVEQFADDQGAGLRAGRPAHHLTRLTTRT